jgi:hypothetical protein
MHRRQCQYYHLYDTRDEACTKRTKENERTSRIFESNGHAECAREFAMHLRFSCPSSYSSPRGQIGKVLGRDGICQVVINIISRGVPRVRIHYLGIRMQSGDRF